MANKYTYPRVTVSHTAKQHSSVQPAPADTTVMFVPIVTKKGPHREIVAVHSLSEFISIFGNLDYETNGQMALNLYNWLRNGGTAYVFRLAGYTSTDQNKHKIVNQVKAQIKDANAESIWENSRIVLTRHDLDFTNVQPGNTKYITEWTLNDLDEYQPGWEKVEFYEDHYNKQILRQSTIDPAGTYIAKLDTFVRMPADIALYDFLKDHDLCNENCYFYADAIAGSEPGTQSSILNPITYEIWKEQNESMGNKDLSYSAYEDNITYKNVLFIIEKRLKAEINNKEDESYALALTAVTGIAKKSKDVPKPSYGSAKYYGEYYNNLEIVIDVLQDEKINSISGSIEKNAIFSITVYENTANSKLVIERFPRRTKANYKNSILSSEFIGEDFDITSLFSSDNFKAGRSIKLSMSGADDNDVDTDLDALRIFWTSRDTEVLGNPSETPIDIMFDAGYPIDIKQGMMEFINNANGAANRPDIVGIFDTMVLGTGADGKFGYLNPLTDVEFNFGDEAVATNIALYGQYFLISDEIFTSQNIYVTPTYFLSKLIAYNDMNYGIQFPTAGIRRGILDDAEAIFKNPNADDKQTYFDARVNYAEKTPREYAFMSQRTHDNSSEESYTALSFLNNIRVLEKMKKELERLGRNYLFEFNDSITLSQLSNVLNKYVMSWIANRTLATGVVTVAKNPWSDEAVDVNLTIKFNGTIEVISVDITIE